MAEIVKARDTSGPEPCFVAIKRILPHLCDQPQYRDMFLDESRVLAQLSHTSVIHAFEIGEIEGTPYIALEYVDGQDARVLFHATSGDGPGIPIELACFIVARVCEGLHHAHEQKDANGQLLGVVHRDVSLQNVLISYDGDVKLTDFGIAVSAENLARTEAGVVKGKFGYMSPEQIKGAPLDRRSDVFATGICLYELLTSERLFSGENDYKAVERVRNVDIELPSTHNRQIPSELEQIVMKALAKAPRDRYQTSNDLRRALQSFLSNAGALVEREDLGAFMRHVFAAEYAGQPSPSVPPEPASGLLHDVSVARGPAPNSAADDWTSAPTGEVTTGLAAFDHLEPVSSLHVMPDDPAPEPVAAARPNGSGTLRLHAVGSRPPGALSVPPLIPSAASIPPSNSRRSPLPGSPESETPTGRFDMDWDEEEPTTVSQGLQDVPSFIHDAQDTEVTRRVSVDEVAELEAKRAAAARAPQPSIRERSLPTLEIPQQQRGVGAGFAVLVGLSAAAALIAAFYFARDRGHGNLRLETDPADALVRVDGKRVPVASSPFVLTNLAAAVDHTITVEKPGFVGWSTQLRVAPAKTLSLPVVRLEPIAANPAIAVPAEQPATAPAPSTPSTPTPAVASGRSRSSSSSSSAKSTSKPRPKSASVPHVQRVVALPGSSGAAKSSGAGTGTLRINSRPWSQITIDGRPAGNTPQMNLPLAAGSHKVVLRNAEFGITKTLTVNIKSGEVTMQVITLAP